MKFISKIVDVGNHLMGKGATSIELNEEIQRLKYFLSDINLAIDVGANQGQYSKELLKEFKVKELHLFEPLKTACKNIEQNIEINSNIKIVCKGLSDKDEIKNIYYNIPISAQASIYERPNEKDYDKMSNFEAVELIKFDDYWVEELESRPIDFIKIDTEGHDLMCLFGAKKALNTTKVVQFEFGSTMVGSKTFFLDFYTFFNDLNFQLYRMRPNGLYKINRHKFIDEHFVYSNFLAVNRELINQ
jgi:FkbM family methyltransferase